MQLPGTKLALLLSFQACVQMQHLSPLQNVSHSLGNDLASLVFPLSSCLVVLISRSRAIFNSPSLEDLGTFSCVVTNTEGISSSYTLTEAGESAHSLGISARVRLKLDSLVICLGDISAKGVRRA